MDFGLSEEQALLQDSINRCLDANAPLDAVRRVAAGKDTDAAIWSALCEIGAGALLVPEAQGGVGLAPLDAALVAECLGYHCTPSPFLGSAILGALALTGAGDQDDRLARLAAGELRMGIALAEAVAARADAGIRSSQGQLTGKALFVLDPAADEYLVADRHRRLFLVAAAAARVSVVPTIDRTRPTCELTFDGAPATLLSENPGILDDLIDTGRVMLAADTLGAAQNMLDQAVAYAKERHQFNRPIGSFQAVKHLCAEMAASLEPCRAMVWYAAHALSEVPGEAHLTACHTKAHVAEVGTFVARKATEVHGGMGFTDLLGLHYWFKRIGFNRQMLGAPELVREEAARAQRLTA